MQTINNATTTMYVPAKAVNLTGTRAVLVEALAGTVTDALRQNGGTVTITTAG